MMRERSVRKAKERAVEHLHEITANYYKASNNENSKTPKRVNKTTTTNKNNNRNDSLSE
jgi:hypothetical protein